MYSKFAVLAILSFVSVNVCAAPAPAPGLFDEITSLFQEATSDVASDFDIATSDVVSKISSATAAVGSVVESVRESATGCLTVDGFITASSVFADVTSILGTETQSAYATIITASGVPVVEVTSVNGPAITIATSSGMTTSFAGHTFTVATPTSTSSTSASPTSSKSSAAGMSSSGMSKRMLLSVATVVGGMLAGALVL
ncbi:hypothetical protein BC835DRAFT_1305121 [Cytidiella melzeri]|nr:hypothetical protein BC835DRAFT_1305121 [Cytidiella melzeri]